jgi:hypothetical protein
MRYWYHSYLLFLHHFLQVLQWFPLVQTNWDYRRQMWDWLVQMN